MNGIGHVDSFVRAISIQSCLAPVSQETHIYLLNLGTIVLFSYVSFLSSYFRNYLCE